MQKFKVGFFTTPMQIMKPDLTNLEKGMIIVTVGYARAPFAAAVKSSRRAVTNSKGEANCETTP